jgi:hypothetical protein
MCAFSPSIYAALGSCVTLKNENFQWRLYQEQSGEASQSLSNSNATTTLIEVSGNKNADPGRPTHDGAETIEIKVKLDPKVIHPTDTYEK